MKWLIIFPSWVFLASYLIYKVKQANHGAVDSSAEEGKAMIAYSEGDIEAPPKRPATARMALINRDGLLFAERVRLLPYSDGGEGSLNGVSPLMPLDGVGGKADRLARWSEIDQWRLFETDQLSFYYPAAEGFRVEESGGDVAPAMFGEIFYQHDVEPQRWYRVIGPGDVTWCAFAVDGGTEFDLAERSPSPEAFHCLLLAGRGAARASLDEAGRLSRVQWLGDGIRVSMLAWQHGAAHQEAYVAAASTLHLAGKMRKRGELHALVSAADHEARMGLLRRGMTGQKVEGLLGSPAGRSGETWLYEVPHRDGDRFYRLDMAGGEFRGLREGWREVRKDPPIKGSVAWMLEKTEIRTGSPGGVGYDLGVLSDEDIELISAQVRERLPTASEQEWQVLCEVLANLAERRLTETGALELVKSRFLDPGLPSRSAMLVLRTWDAEGARALFAQKGKDLIAGRCAAEEGLRSDDLQMLIAYVGEDHPEVGALVSGAARHRDDEFRGVGYTFWNWFGEHERHGLICAGLGDRCVQVRRRCAEAFASGCAQAGDAELLKECLTGEADAETREHLGRALEGL